MNPRKLSMTAVLLTVIASLAVAWVPTPSASPAAPAIRVVFTSDSHFGITRASFEGAKNVDSLKVNAELVAAINGLPTVELPCSDGGVSACELVGPIDFVVNAGDIANVPQILSTTPVTTCVQDAATSWAQFETDYIKGLTAKDKSGNQAPLYLLPGNHDVYDTLGIPGVCPILDATSMAQVFNRMLQPATPKTKETYSYATDKINYSKDIGGVHFQFIHLWPDSAARAWMADDLQKVSESTPVVIFAHSEPDVRANFFTNPNGKHDVNATDKFQNLLVDQFADSTKINDAAGNPVPSLIEQRALVAFLKEHKNIVAYFHGNSNWNQFYTYTGPDNDIALNTFRVDSPMKGEVSGKYENTLSFQVVSIDGRAQTMTVREYLWETKTWATSVTVSLAPRAR